MSEYYRLNKDRYTTCINCKDRKHQHYIYNNIILCGDCLREIVENEKENSKDNS